MSLKQKHALITGASRGIGRGIALKLADEGVKVGVHYYRNKSAHWQRSASAVLTGSSCKLTSAGLVRSRVCSPRSGHNSESWKSS